MNLPIEAIKQAVAENRTGDALSRLLELSQNDKPLYDSILIISGEFRELTSQQLKGTIDNSEATRRLNVIHDKILVALGAFDSQGRVLPGSDVMKKASTVGVLSKITLFFVAGVILPCTLVLLLFGIKPFEGNPQGRTMISDILLGISIISGVIGAITFLAYLLALIVSASKK